MNDATSTVHGGADVPNAEPSPERGMLHVMRAYNDSLLDQGDEGRANSRAMQAALDAHQSMAGEPVAEVVEWEEDDGTTKHVVSFLCPLAEIPVGAKLYAAPPSAEPAQPVEKDGDRVNLIDSVRSLRDRWMATTRHDGHDGDFDILLEVIDRLKRDDALAHPRPTVEQAGEATCERCGATSDKDAETRCIPDGDSCPGCEEPLHSAWQAGEVVVYTYQFDYEDQSRHLLDGPVADGDKFVTLDAYKALLALIGHPRPVGDDSADKAERMLSELVDKIMPGLDTGDLLSDAVTASRALDVRPTDVPDGWKLVPVEPTTAMSAAGFCVNEAEHDPAGVYRAMLAAAPAPAKAGEA